MIDDFGYEPPINIYFGEIQTQVENEIMKAVAGVGVHVDKEELLAALRYDRGQYEKGYQDGLNVNKWIPVEDRLPEDGKDVLITDTNKIVRKIKFNMWLYEHQQYSHNIIPVAWMPIPAPYDMRKKVEE